MKQAYIDTPSLIFSKPMPERHSLKLGPPTKLHSCENVLVKARLHTLDIKCNDTDLVFYSHSSIAGLLNLCLSEIWILDSVILHRPHAYVICLQVSVCT